MAQGDPPGPSSGSWSGQGCFPGFSVSGKVGALWEGEVTLRYHCPRRDLPQPPVSCLPTSPPCPAGPNLPGAPYRKVAFETLIPPCVCESQRSAATWK